MNRILQEKYSNIEASVINLSKVRKNNRIFRFDSEPFKKSNLLNNANYEYVELGQIATINPPKTKVTNLPDDKKISFISMQNLGFGFINEQESGILGEFKNGYTYFAENDIIVAKITPSMEQGKCAIATDLISEIGFGSTEFNIFRIHDERFLKEFIFCFLNREHIRKIASDNMTGTSGRQRVPVDFYENLRIPLLSKTFQNCIKTVIQKAYELRKVSNKIYKQAEKELTNCLKFDIKQTSNMAVKRFSETYNKTKRLDAEYYQLKYDNFENFIKNYKNGYTTAKEQFDIIKDKCSYDLLKYPYIEIGDINIENGNAEFNVLQTRDLPTNAKIMTKKGDLIISTVRPYRGAVAILCSDDLLVSGAFTVLREKSDYPAQTLQVLFRTELYKSWLLKYNVGTSYPVIKDDDVLNIIIPIFDKDTNKKITALIAKAYTKLDYSKVVTELAIQAVEKAIEKDENIAMQWLTKSLLSSNI